MESKKNRFSLWLTLIQVIEDLPVPVTPKKGGSCSSTFLTALGTRPFPWWKPACHCSGTDVLWQLGFVALKWQQWRVGCFIFGLWPWVIMCWFDFVCENGDLFFNPRKKNMWHGRTFLLFCPSKWHSKSLNIHPGGEIMVARDDIFSYWTPRILKITG